MYEINRVNNCPYRSKLLLTPLIRSKNRPEPKHLSLAAITKFKGLNITDQNICSTTGLTVMGPGKFKFVLMLNVIMILILFSPESKTKNVCRLRQTANAKHSDGYKNKIIDREIYYI